MNKLRLYTKQFVNEKQAEYQLDYSLLIRSAEQGQVFGVAVQQRDVSAVVEDETVEGLFENRHEAEAFLSRLAEGLALPVELAALCDDYISEREFKTEYKYVQAVS